MNFIPLIIDTTNGRISLIVYQNDSRFTDFQVSQSKNGTLLHLSDSRVTKNKYKEFQLPSPRYSLVHDKPRSGAAGRKEFDRDFLNILRDQSLIPELFNEKKKVSIEDKNAAIAARRLNKY